MTENTNETSVNETELLGMSDEDILNMSQPPETSEEEPVEETVEETEEVQEQEASSEEEEEQTEESVEEEEEDNPLNQKDDEVTEKKKDKKEKEKEPVTETKEEETDTEKEEVKIEEAPVNYEDAYNKIFAPFKASGRTLQMKTPEEVISLMQRGADYTRKMQALKPNLKLMKMLENNGLLDESKLSFMIDLDKKDPAAISRFLKDKEIDPLDLDIEQEKDYKPGNHTVSDEEMRFNSMLEDVQSTPTGKETIRVIDKQWDKQSQGRVFQEPSILKLIDTHRETGIYEQITSEIERLKILNIISEDTVFLDAYKAVGDELHNSGKLLLNGVPTNTPVNQPKKEQPTRQVIETRPASPKPAVRNNAAAKAAAPTRASPKTAKPDFNPLAMSDEEFEKQAGNFRI